MDGKVVLFGSFFYHLAYIRVKTVISVLFVIEREESPVFVYHIVCFEWYSGYIDGTYGCAGISLLST